MCDEFSEEYFKILMSSVENSRYSSISLNINRPNYNNESRTEPHYYSNSNISKYYSNYRDRISNYVNNA